MIIARAALWSSRSSSPMQACKAPYYPEQVQRLKRWRRKRRKFSTRAYTTGTGWGLDVYRECQGLITSSNLIQAARFELTFSNVCLSIFPDALCVVVFFRGRSTLVSRPPFPRQRLLLSGCMKREFAVPSRPTKAAGGGGWWESFFQFPICIYVRRFILRVITAACSVFISIGTRRVFMRVLIVLPGDNRWTLWSLRVGVYSCR